GQAVVNEVLFERMRDNWQQLNDPQNNPVTLLLAMIEDAVEHADRDTIALGCPLNNLVQEMAGLDEDFRKCLNKVQSAWRDALSSALKRGQQNGQVRRNLDADQAAAFLVGAYEGCVGVGKCGAGTEVFTTCLKGMADYLHTLRPAHN
ncbi:MAG: TetR family transcriptional regulator C-terminal domain-containing protein, partial [Gammaproteobacteria bacterium]|nr:TetR family transcriptional regulator C-terminal domain-containing protein [Gammaproteobacteria bacterium]